MTTVAGTQSEKSVRYLKGIGPKKYELLQKLGVETVRDLCYFFPRRYEDRSHFHKISEAQIGAFVTLRGKVTAVNLKPLKRIKLLEVWIQDDSGTVPAIWFNQIFLKKIFQVGAQVILSGKLDRYQSRIQMTTPEYEILDAGDENPVHTGRITPIYPLTEGLYQRSLRVVIKDLVDKNFDHEITEYLPSKLIQKYHFLNLIEAIKEIHFPSSLESLAQAKTRLIFDEFFLFQFQLIQKMKEISSKYKSIPFKISKDSIQEFDSKLKFRLTADQKNTMQEIWTDVSKNVPMNRLLQGEVGSGKTVVAAFFLWQAALNQMQTAFLAPTEVLVEQHFITLKELLSPYSIKIELLTASVVGDKRSEILNGLLTGDIQVLVGTHAVLQESVNFKNLGFVVVDEQHKFGVRQRGQLLQRNPRPHLLVMSATPIPRTLGLTLYGDLEISTIKELPKGRKSITTYHFPSKDSKKATNFIKERLKNGEQAYIVFPVIEESENLDVQAARKEFARLQVEDFKGISIGLVHGKVPKAERDQTMLDFISGKIKVLVATSVIEVGIDNQKATVMVIENADRFGLSQLHQIRGRIGRGRSESHCFLIANPKTDEAKKRIEILLKSQDGFLIAEEDLKLRGPGEFFGMKQSGAPQFRIADLLRDYEWLIKSRQDARELILRDPELKLPENQTLHSRPDLT